MLRTRIITAVILLLMFILIFFTLDKNQFAWAMLVISLIAAWEWGNLSFRKNFLASGFFALCCTVFMLWVWQTQTHLMLPIVVIASGIWLVMPLLIKHWAGMTSAVNSASVVGFMVIVPCFFAIVLLRNLAETGSTLFYLWAMLFVVWAADVGAYFSGKRFGKTPLAPRISPNKTWEGFFGGLGLTLIISLIFWFLHNGESPLPLLSWLGVCVATAIYSVYGDLLESLFKRMAGVKDSGSILPGHGGVLDRLDGVLAGAPVFVSLLYLTGLQKFVVG
jgi:phosphatidate cytidylyltransferase